MFSQTNEKSVRITKMKYRLIIDKECDEEIVAKVRTPSPLTREIEKLVNSYSGEMEITGYTVDTMKRLSFDEIECITVIDRHVLAIDRCGQRYRVSERLRDLECILPKYFIRINKSTLANENHIVKFFATYSGSVDALLKCGYRDYVSRRCFAEIKRRYGRK